jgi:hypothetical protein
MMQVTLRGLLHTVSLIAVTAVPAAGWFVEDWSAGTTLAVYWFETVAACLCVAVRIAVHQRLTPRRGHFRYQAPSDSGNTGKSASFLDGFLVGSLAFCGAHAVFLAMLLFVLTSNGLSGLARVEWSSVVSGCLIVFAILVVDLAVDLPRIRTWPFLRIEQAAARGMGRVVVVHMTLIFGLFAAAFTGAPSAFFGVFVALKTLYSLSLLLPQWQPATPPKWLSSLMNRVPNVHPGERFEDYWADDIDAEADRRERNEQPWRGRAGRTTRSD